MSTKLATIGEILEMTPGTTDNATWINDDFEAVVSDVKPSKGKGPATAVLTCPHNSGVAILGNFFGVDPSRFAGKVCHFSGKGLKRTEYKGTQQISMGDKATIQIVGEAKSGSISKSPSSGPSAPGAASTAVHGDTVGMAINQAASILRENPSCPEGHECAYFQSAAFLRDLWNIASDIVRVSRAMESGNLAEPAKVRNEDPAAKAKREADKQAAFEQAEAARKAKEAEAAKEANLTPAADWAPEDVSF